MVLVSHSNHRTEASEHAREGHADKSPPPVKINALGLFEEWRDNKALRTPTALTERGQEPKSITFTNPYGDGTEAGRQSAGKQHSGFFSGSNESLLSRRDRGKEAPPAAGYKAANESAVLPPGKEPRFLEFGDPYNFNHKVSESRDSKHDRSVQDVERRLAQSLGKKPGDFQQVFKELDAFRRAEGKIDYRDLAEINDHLHKQGVLGRNLHIIEDNRDGHKGWAVVADDRSNPDRKGHGGQRDSTIVSTSHHAPRESHALRHFYSHMHYRRGHYSGWRQSAEGGGGAHGGFDHQAVGGHVPVGARKELIDEALKLAGVPVTPQNEAAVNKIVIRESGWNPNITNNWDSNARAGHPSTGLMQTIPSTFKAFALPGYNNNIHDPLSNLVAGIRYAQAKYGGHGMSGLEWVADHRHNY